MSARIRATLPVALCILLGATLGQSEESPPAASSRTPLASVDGEVWYAEDVEGAVGIRVFQHRVDIYSLLVGEAERRIDERLLAAEAAKRGVSVKAMLDSVLAGAEGEASTVTDADIDRYLTERGDPSKLSSDAARARVRQYLEESQRIERRIAFLAALREAADAKILLAPPQPGRSDIALGSAPVRGPADAPITLVHFANLGSRGSARSVERIARLIEAYPGRIRWAHLHFLNGRDERGLAAARLAFLAQDVGRFWDYHDAVFEGQGKLTPSELEAMATGVAVSADKIAGASEDTSLLRRVKADLDLGNRVGVQREPAIFLNGRFVSGLLSYEELESIFVEELTRVSTQGTKSAAQN